MPTNQYRTIIVDKATKTASCKLTLRRVSRKGILDFADLSSLALASHMSTDSSSANTQLMQGLQIEAYLMIIIVCEKWLVCWNVFYRFRRATASLVSRSSVDMHAICKKLDSPSVIHHYDYRGLGHNFDRYIME